MLQSHGQRNRKPQPPLRDQEKIAAQRGGQRLNKLPVGGRHILLQGSLDAEVDVLHLAHAASSEAEGPVSLAGVGAVGRGMSAGHAAPVGQ